MERKKLVVASLATQFIRSIGATVGTALMGLPVTAGYTRRLVENLPAGTPPALATALADPDTIINPDAREALGALAAQRTAALQDGLTTAQTALSGGIHDEFECALVGAIAALGLTLLLSDVRLKPGAANAGGRARSG